MSAELLDGKSLSRKIREGLKTRVDHLRSRGILPRLDVIVAAQDAASLAYVRMKRKWAEEIGMEGKTYDITDATTREELLQRVYELNANSRVHGVLIQHPLPSHLNEDEALLALGAEKDVDGITPQSLGRLTAGLPGFRCATPLGIMKLLSEYSIDLEGKQALVIGRSNILGKPAALMLLQANATVTVAHSRTRDLADTVRRADVVVAAVGKPEFVKGDWIKTGAVVVDAGYNRVEGRTHDVGDCEFETCSERASFITPVPGGVGPMTVACLLSNAVDAAEAQSSS